MVPPTRNPHPLSNYPQSSPQYYSKPQSKNQCHHLPNYFSHYSHDNPQAGHLKNYLSVFSSNDPNINVLIFIPILIFIIFFLWAILWQYSSVLFFLLFIAGCFDSLVCHSCSLAVSFIIRTGRILVLVSVVMIEMQLLIINCS